MRVSFIALLLFLIGLCSSAPADRPEDSREAELTVLTYNIHHGAGTDGRVDIARIARVIMDAKPDLVALQEVDRFVERTARADQAQQLADLTGMHMRFGFAINYQGGDFGNVVLSRHPILDYTSFPLPGDPGENRVLQRTTISLDTGGAEPDTVIFWATHLDTFDRPRKEAIPLILEQIPVSSTQLHILAGDLNATPTTPEIQSLTDRLMLPEPTPALWTFPAQEPNRQLDYILYTETPDWKFDQVWVIPEQKASDHAPIAARFLAN